MEKIKIIINALQSKYSFHKAFIFILCMSNIFYLFYVLAIAHHNVLLYDDYWFMAKYNKYGIFGSISWWYQYWQGRFSPQLFINFVVKGYESIHSLLPYTVLLISIFIYSIQRLIKQLLPAPTKHIKYFHFLTFNLAVFFFNLFLIVNFEFSTFYWITVSTMYFGGVAFALLGTTELISKSKSIFSYLIIGFGFTYAGSSSEHFGVISALVLLLYIILLQYQKKVTDHAFSTTLNKAYVAFIFCAISFVIMISAPGNEIRREDYPKISIFEAPLIGLKSLYYLFTVLIAEKAKYLVILSFPFIYLGALVRKRKDTIDDFKMTLIVAGSLPLFVFFLYMCLIPTAYAVSGIGPFRALTHIAFFLVSYVAILSFLIGYLTLFPKKVAFTLSVFCCLFFMVISRDRIKINLPETIKYSQSEKARISKIIELKANGNKRPVVLDSLYASPKNVLLYNEIEKDSLEIDKYWINRCISDGLGLGFVITVKK